MVPRGEAVIQPDGVADDLGGKAVSVVARRVAFSSTKFATRPLNLTVPHPTSETEHRISP